MAGPQVFPAASSAKPAPVACRYISKGQTCVLTQASIAEAFLRMTLLLLLLCCQTFIKFSMNLIISKILSKLVENGNLLCALIKINRFSRNVVFTIFEKCINLFVIHFSYLVKINQVLLVLLALHSMKAFHSFDTES